MSSTTTSSILIISTILFLTTIEAAPQDLGSPIRIAQCRALCLDKVQTEFFLLFHYFFLTLGRILSDCYKVLSLQSFYT